VNTVRTVSDTKRAFYLNHNRPINSIYRRVVEELMVEMHLLNVNTEFKYDSVYALGVITTLERFMQGYRPEQDKVSIFNGLCQAMGQNPDQYRHDAAEMQNAATQLTPEQLIAQLGDGEGSSSPIIAQLKQSSSNPQFKYSRLFAIGLYTLLETMDADLVKDEKRRTDALKALAEKLNLSFDKVQKDLELYRSNLDKFAQAQIVMEDILKADRKRKEDRAKADEAIAQPPSPSQEPS
jgi:photosystem II biogenesis protein Psp29